MKFVISVATFALLLAACGGDPTAPLDAHTAHGVAITVTSPGPCLVGGCDPPGVGLTLSLVSFVNSGNVPAYLHACGTQLDATEQAVEGGTWANVGDAYECGVTPGPIQLAAGDSIRMNWWFGPGTRRVLVGVSSMESEVDEAQAISAAFQISP